MSDWADEIANTMIAGWWRDADDMGYEPDKHQIAAALRKARIDGMQDLANVVHAYRDSPALMKAIDDTINSFKDKQP